MKWFNVQVYITVYLFYCLRVILAPLSTIKLILNKAHVVKALYLNFTIKE